MGIEKPRQRFRIDIGIAQPALLDLVGQTLCGAGHLVAATVIQGDRQMHQIVPRGQQLQLIHQPDQFFIQPHTVSDKTDTHAVRQQRLVEDALFG